MSKLSDAAQAQYDALSAKISDLQQIARNIVGGQS